MGIFSRVADRIDRQGQLMGSMMDCLDVDLERACREGEGWRMENAIRSCILCRDSDACACWLRRHAKDECVSGPPFCPNHIFFAQHRKKH